MAIHPSNQFTGKIDTTDTTNYPLGKARNITTSGDGTGTPWVAPLVNDIFGLQQALLTHAGVTPNGAPDTAPLSQYLEALQKLNGRQIFEADGTFTTPPWVKRLRVTCVGGGGGGGNFSSTTAGSGGGGGATATRVIDDPLPSYAVVIGEGGAGAPTAASGSGAAGGTTLFGGAVSAGGGAGGSGTVSGAPGAGGRTGDGDLVMPGQNGEAGNTTQSAGNGVFNTGTSGQGGGSTHGQGGFGGRNAFARGQDGFRFGGGGGGGNREGGGNGTGGLVIVEWGIL